MSGILFQINHGNSPVNKREFNKMFSRIKHRGGDSSNTLFIKNTGLGCHDFWTTPEDLGQKQPIVSSDNKYFLLLDGRLDNRVELLDMLGINSGSETDLSDGNIILLAYERWKERSFEKLIGSFAFIIYCPEEKYAVAVRDQVGDRSLFYYSSSKLTIIASEPYSIVAHEKIPMEINESKVAEYLASSHPTQDTTYFKNIYEIRPSHYLSTGEKETAIRNYWSINLAEKIRYGSDSDYAEHFLEIMNKSVLSKMRSVAVPGVMMSGGLDSTTIAALAAKSTKEKVRAFTYAFNEYGECDESSYVDSFCNMYDVESIRLNGDDYLPLFDINSMCISPNFPNQDSYQALKNKLYTEVIDSGTNILLTGWYADELFMNAEYWLKDCLRDFKFDRAYKTLSPAISKNGWKWLRGNSAVRVALRPLRHIKNFIFGYPVQKDNYFYLTPYSKSLLNSDIRWDEHIHNGERAGQIMNVLGLRSAFDASACSHCMTGLNIDFRYPFRDLRLIDFFLRIPAYQLYDSSEYKNKYILKEAMRGQLPEDLIQRTEITTFMSLLDSSYNRLKKNMDKSIELNKEELGKYIENNILNAIINKEFKDLNDLEYNIYWHLFTYLKWKSFVFK